jgi:AraC-like DNA-binding protein/mannose-6-phosphate isomerase-like protein (cupin superfamily)
MIVYTAEKFIKEGTSIGIFSTREPKHICLHRHDFIEIVYISSGTATEYVDGAKYEVKRGDMLFINIGSNHAFEPHKDFAYVNISFLPEIVSDVIITKENAFSLLSLTAFNEMQKDADGAVISFHGDERKEVENIIEAMQKEYNGDKYGSKSVIECYMNILITKMLRKTQVGAFNGEGVDLWYELSDYIDHNLGNELTLSTLAQKCFYNPSYFSRMFKQKFGTSLTEYVGRKRVELAVKLLRETEIQVDEIARKSGFTDRSTFYHAFSKYTGKSPSDFRN